MHTRYSRRINLKQMNIVHEQRLSNQRKFKLKLTYQLAEKIRSVSNKPLIRQSKVK